MRIYKDLQGSMAYFTIVFYIYLLMNAITTARYSVRKAGCAAFCNNSKIRLKSGKP